MESHPLVNLKLAMKRMHSSRQPKTVYSPPNGFFRKYRSKLQHKTNIRQINFKPNIRVCCMQESLNLLSYEH